MGMFDYVKFECECPDCGCPVTEFQSKDGECDMVTLLPEDVKNFYTSCPCCKLWIEFSTMSENRETHWMNGSTPVRIVNGELV
jgi:hypothetical protein